MRMYCPCSLAYFLLPASLWCWTKLSFKVLRVRTLIPPWKRVGLRKLDPAHNMDISKMAFLTRFSGNDGLLGIILIPMTWIEFSVGSSSGTFRCKVISAISLFLWAYPSFRIAVGHYCMNLLLILTPSRLLVPLEQVSFSDLEGQ